MGNKVKLWRWRPMLAVCAALVVAVCAFPVSGFISTNAQSKAAAWVIPKKEDGLLGARVENWWSNRLTLQNLDEGGLRYNWTNGWHTVREGMKQTFPLDGLTLKFKNFSRNDQNGRLGILIGSQGGQVLNYDPDDEGAKPLALLLNIADGGLWVYPANRKIIEDTTSAYASIGIGKEFSISLKKADGRDYTVTLAVEGEKTLTGTISSADIRAAGQLTDTEYVHAALDSWGPNIMQVDFMAIGPARQAAVDPGITPLSMEEALLFNKGEGAASWWKDKFTLDNSPAGGIHFEWTPAAGINVRECLKERFALDGLKLQFDNLQYKREAIDGADGLFAILLGDNEYAEYKPEADYPCKPLALVFDTQRGRLFAYPSGRTIISDSRLSYESIENRPFSLLIQSAGTTSYKVTVAVGSEVRVSGLLTKDDLKQAVDLSDYESCSVMLSRWKDSFKANAGDAGDAGILALDFIGAGHVETEKAGEQLVIPTRELSVTGETWAADTSFVRTYYPQIGAHYEWKNGVTDMRDGVNMAFPTDGLTLSFTNFSSQTGGLAVLLSSRGGWFNSYWDGTALALALDPDKGTLTANYWDTSANANVSVSLIENDFLKYDAIKGKPFSIQLKAVSNGFSIAFQMKDGQELSGVLPSSFIEKAPSALFDTGYVFALIAPWGKGEASGNWNTQNTSVDFLGVGPAWAPEEDDSMTILSTAEGYGDFAKWWPERFSVTNLPEGGLQYVWLDGATDIRDGLTKTFDLNGLTLQINAIRQDLSTYDASSAALAFFIGNSDDMNYKEWESAHPLALVLDLKQGVLKAMPSNEIIIQDGDFLSYAKVAGKPIKLQISKAEDGSEDYTVTMTVGSYEKKGTLSATAVAAAADLTNAEACKVFLSAWGASKNLAVQFLGIKTSRLPKVRAAINALKNNVSLEDARPVRDARELFEQLPDSEKALITNLKILTDAEEEYARLTKEADGDLTPMNLGNAYMSSGGNEMVKQTLEAWAPYMQLADLSNGEGLRFTFSRAGTNVREGYARLGMDGLKLQFDNLKLSKESMAKMALFFGAPEGAYLPQYRQGEEPTQTFALVLNAEAGKIVAYPGEETVIQSNSLKYDHIRQRRFSYSFRENEDGSYSMMVKVGDEELTGSISEAVIGVVEAVSNTGMALSVWGESQSLSVDLLGMDLPVTPSAVMELIDDIGLVTTESGPAIENARNAYNKLSASWQKMVGNITTLQKAEAYYELLDEATMIGDAERAIDSIGEVTLDSGANLQNAEMLFERLTEGQKQQVSNVDTLKQAREMYAALLDEHGAMDSYYYGPGKAPYFLPGEVESWKDHADFVIRPDGSMHIGWTDAICNMRNGYYGRFSLDGLTWIVANLTREENKDGASLAFIIGSADYPDLYDSKGGALALVLDTANGEIRAYPGGRSFIKDSALLQNAVEGQKIVFTTALTEEGLFRLNVSIGDTSLSGIIPSQAIYQAGDQLTNVESVQLVASPWVDSKDGSIDLSKHTFSVDFISIRNINNDRGVYPMVQEVITEIDELPDVVTTQDIRDVRSVQQKYTALPRALRVLISNYEKLSKLMDQVYEMEKETLWEDGTPGSNTGETSPGTGERRLFPWAILVPAGAALTMGGLFRRQKRKMACR